MEPIGAQIKTFRLKRNLTQEKLAEQLNVTAQAVSKWENGVNAPDVSLLPELSAVLGVTLDELFDVSGETHLRRIEQMIEDFDVLSEEDFRYAERQLREGTQKRETRGRCLTMLSQLYLGHARMYKNMAAQISREALELEPDKKDNHSDLCEAMGGALPDWCCTNHTAIIDYYKGFVAKNPDYAPGYLWYLDNLIADGRLDEAREVLEKMRTVRESYHCELYAGIIAERAGDHPRAQRLWDEMVEKYPDVWFAWSGRADQHVKRAEYAEAIADYREAIARQTPPRFTDNWDSIAQICSITGDYAGAIEAYEHVLEILREDWQLTEGETYAGYEENIRELKRKL